MSKQTINHTDHKAFREAGCPEITITPILSAAGTLYDHDVKIRTITGGTQSFNGVLDIRASAPTAGLVEVALRDYPHMNIIVRDAVQG